MSDLALSFSYNGTHHKSDRSINPIEHLKMLIAAIDCANPKGEHDVIVSAICFDIWSMDQKERNIALEVYKRSRIVLSNSVQKNHQDGAATSIRMATEFAAATGKKYLIHLAEDIATAPDFIEYFLKHLADCDYVGSYWSMYPGSSFNTQVFGCRVSSFANLKKNNFMMPFSIPRESDIERELYNNITSNKLIYKVGDSNKDYKFFYPDKRGCPHLNGAPVLFHHTHDPNVFRKIVEGYGVNWFDETKEIKEIKKRINGSISML